MFVADRAALDTLSGRLRDALATDPRLAVDTEFIRERTYYPLLEVVQVATANGVIAVIDVPALGGDLGTLGDILRDTNILKIFHAGGQDMEILTTCLGIPPLPVFDTQVAAAFAGFALQVGYGALVQSVLSVALTKDEGYSDWSKRPLTPAMITYAENDVRYLHALHDKLTAQLNRRKRTEWVGEQTLRLLMANVEEMPAYDLWQRVGGKNTLSSTQLAVLRELAIWRDDEARRRDKPRRTIIKDEPLIEIARRQPKTAREVLDLRGAPPNLGERSATEIAERVKRGLATPPDERPKLEILPGLDDEGANLVELLSAVVRVRAQQENLPASLLASGDDLRGFAARRTQSSRYEGILFSGWRGEMLGDDLRAVLEGRKTVAWDATKGRLKLIEIAPQTEPEAEKSVENAERETSE